MAIVVLVLLAAVAGFVLRVSGRGERRPVIPPVSHAVTGEMADCLSCHEVGDQGMPRSHATYAVSTCLICHSPRS
ncbi:MAG TPA: hypothetical protein VFV75_10810 [Candidatus Polarisedimenticolaceae bacterium]|nr:hypothetical protein [Candidatus Polarisedimenticolaceae bacterium]